MIKIRYSSSAGLDISGDVETLRGLRYSILNLIEAEISDLAVEAATIFDPAPYEQVVPQLVISRGQDPAKVEIIRGREVRVSGSAESLRAFASCFDFGLGAVFGTHQHYEYFEEHPYNIAPDSVPLVVSIE